MINRYQMVISGQKLRNIWHFLRKFVIDYLVGITAGMFQEYNSVSGRKKIDFTHHWVWIGFAIFIAFPAQNQGLSGFII